MDPGVTVKVEPNWTPELCSARKKQVSFLTKFVSHCFSTRPSRSLGEGRVCFPMSGGIRVLFGETKKSSVLTLRRTSGCSTWFSVTVLFCRPVKARKRKRTRDDDDTDEDSESEAGGAWTCNWCHVETSAKEKKEHIVKHLSCPSPTGVVFPLSLFFFSFGVQGLEFLLKQFSLDPMVTFYSQWQCRRPSTFTPAKVKFSANTSRPILEPKQFQHTLHSERQFRERSV